MDLDLKPHQFVEILNQIPTLKRIKLQGMGEPLLCPYLEDFVLAASLRNIKLETIINGTLLTKNDYIERAKLFDAVTISIDSLDKERFAFLRGGADLDDVLDGLRLLLEDKGNTDVFVNVVVSYYNYLDISEFSRLLDMGVSKIGFVEIQNWHHFDKKVSHLISLNKYFRKKIVEQVKFLEAKYPGKVIYHVPKHPRFCNWLVLYTFITADGFVTPCCLRPNPRIFNLGNVFETPFRKIWRGRKYLELRLSSVLNRSEICYKCPE